MCGGRNSKESSKILAGPDKTSLQPHGTVRQPPSPSGASVFSKHKNETFILHLQCDIDTEDDDVQEYHSVNVDCFRVPGESTYQEQGSWGDAGQWVTKE